MLAARTELRLSLLLRQAEQRVNDRLAAALEGSGVSLEQWRVLSLLDDGAGHSMSELSEAAMLPAPSLTRLVDKIVELNLVYRRVDPTDRRRILVFLSSRGRTRAKRLVEVERRVQREIAESLGAPEFDEFAGVLAHLVDRLGAA
jgi:DNA-binding MarR family transcriptional regulator